MDDTEPSVGLPTADRATVGALVQTCLVTIQPGMTHGAGVQAMAAMITDVGDRYGHPGLFEVATTAALMITDGEHPDMTFIGSANRRPSTPTDYAVHRFIGRVMAGDRAAAYKIVVGLIPDDIGPDDYIPDDGAALLLNLLWEAWNRQAGGSVVHVAKGDGKLWPPTCDFCGDRGRAAWMWHAAPGAAGGTVPGMHGVIQWSSTEDYTHWYACDGCRPYIARPRPTWLNVWQRRQSVEPSADRAVAFGWFTMFEKSRRDYRPVPLPPSRPAPTTGRG